MSYAEALLQRYFSICGIVGINHTLHYNCTPKHTLRWLMGWLRLVVSLKCFEICAHTHTHTHVYICINTLIYMYIYLGVCQRGQTAGVKERLKILNHD